MFSRLTCLVLWSHCDDDDDDDDDDDADDDDDEADDDDDDDLVTGTMPAGHPTRL